MGISPIGPEGPAGAAHQLDSSPFSASVAPPPSAIPAVPLRLVLPMVNEAARALAEGVVDSADTVDLATVLGLGLAPFRGGLAHWAEAEGLGRLVGQMDELASRFGAHLAAAEPLRRVASAGGTLADLVSAHQPGDRPGAAGPAEATSRRTGRGR